MKIDIYIANYSDVLLRLQSRQTFNSIVNAIE